MVLRKVHESFIVASIKENSEAVNRNLVNELLYCSMQLDRALEGLKSPDGPKLYTKFEIDLLKLVYEMKCMGRSLEIDCIINANHWRKLAFIKKEKEWEES